MGKDSRSLRLCRCSPHRYHCPLIELSRRRREKRPRQRCAVEGRRERAEQHLQARRGNAAAATPTSRKAVGGPLHSKSAATAAAAAAVAIDTPRGVYAPNNSCERLFVAAAPTRCCACLPRAPKQRPPVGSGDVRQLRDFAPRLVQPGGRYLGGGLGMGGVLNFSHALPAVRCAVGLRNVRSSR